MDIGLHSQQSQTKSSKFTLSRYTLITLGVFSLVFLLALGLRLLLVEGDYPVLQTQDELLRFLHTMRIRDDMPEIAVDWGVYVVNAQNFDYTGFPPVQQWVHAPVQRMVEASKPFPFPTDYILWARYPSLIASLLTTVFTAWAGWYLARPLGEVPALVSGLAASLVFTVSPLILEIGNLAIIDPLLYPYVPLAVVCAAYAIRADAPVGAVGALVFTIGAIYTKYIMVYAPDTSPSGGRDTMPSTAPAAM